MLRWTLTCCAVCVFVELCRAEDGPLGAFPPETIDLPAAESEPLEPLTVRVYPVADLVVSPRAATPTTSVALETSPLPGASAPRLSPEIAPDQQYLADLSVTLQSTVEPASWEMSGGHGHIAVHGPTLSLIVRQADSVHEQISDLLTQLRRCQQTEVRVSVEIFQEQPGDPRALHILADYDEHLLAEEVHQLHNELEGVAKVVWSRRLLLQNGGSGHLAGPFSCRAIIAPDRRSVLVHWVTDDSDPANSAGFEQHRIPDRRSVLIPVGENADAPLLALVSVEITIPDEEEELFPVPELEHKDPTPLAPAEQLAEEDPFAQPVSFETTSESAAEQSNAQSPDAPRRLPPIVEHPRQHPLTDEVVTRWTLALAELQERRQREAAERRERELQAQSAREAVERERMEIEHHRAAQGDREQSERDRHLAEATEHLLAAGCPELAQAVLQHARNGQRERLHHRLHEIEQQQHALQREAELLRRELHELESPTRR